MKTLRASVVFAFLLACLQAFGGTERSSVELPPTEFNPRSFELAVESAYLFGAINPPADYQIGAEFMTARIRWGMVRSNTWLRGQTDPSWVYGYDAWTAPLAAST